jgi:hypothetical protein
MFMDQGGYAQLKAIALQRPPGRDEVRVLDWQCSIITEWLRPSDSGPVAAVAAPKESAPSATRLTCTR